LIHICGFERVGGGEWRRLQHGGEVSRRFNDSNEAMGPNKYCKAVDVPVIALVGRGSVRGWKMELVEASVFGETACAEGR